MMPLTRELCQDMSALDQFSQQWTGESSLKRRVEQMNCADALHDLVGLLNRAIMTAESDTMRASVVSNVLSHTDAQAAMGILCMVSHSYNLSNNALSQALYKTCARYVEVEDSEALQRVLPIVGQLLDMVGALFIS